MSAFAYSCTVVPRSCPGCDWLAWGGGFLGVAAADTRAPRAWLVAIHTSSGRSQPAAARPMGMQRTSAARNKLRRRRRGRAYGDEMMTHGSLCNPHRRATLSRIMTRSVGQRASTTDLADSCACSCGGELAVRAWHRRRGSGARMRTLYAWWGRQGTSSGVARLGPPLFVLALLAGPPLWLVGLALAAPVLRLCHRLLGCRLFCSRLLSRWQLGRQLLGRWPSGRWSSGHRLLGRKFLWQQSLGRRLFGARLRR